MKKLCLLLALILALCACALAEEAAPALTAGDVQGRWELEYVSVQDFVLIADEHGMVVILNLYEDGAADMDFSGDVLSDMSWRIEDGRVYLTGYHTEGDVELLLKDGVLEITDDIGTMAFARPAEEAAQ